MIPLTHKQIQNMQCSDPHCTTEHNDRLWMHSRCHPKSKVNAIVHIKDGIVQITCGACDKDIVVFQLAAE